MESGTTRIAESSILRVFLKAENEIIFKGNLLDDEAHKSTIELTFSIESKINSSGCGVDNFRPINTILTVNDQINKNIISII